MKKISLIVSEKFTSLQGEGQTMGVPSIFLRLSGCNLFCNSPHWRCDTIEVWQRGVKTKFPDILSKQDVEYLEQGYHLIVTGGEPLMHQRALMDYFEWFYDEHGFYPITEIETNGSVIPMDDFLPYVNYWNCSPKLENSGNEFAKRVNPDAIRIIDKQAHTIFKFVVDEERNLQDIFDDYGNYLTPSKIVLMPAGETQDKLAITRPLVAKMCIENGYRFSERLHIVIWNKKTGV